MKFERWFKENEDDLDALLWEQIEDVATSMQVVDIKHLLRQAFWAGFAKNSEPEPKPAGKVACGAFPCICGICNEGVYPTRGV